jgi:hypothetical protein
MNVNVPIEELRRLVEETEEAQMHPDTAQVVCGLRLTPSELARFEELAERLEEGNDLTEAERTEALELSDLSDLLAVLKLRAQPTPRTVATAPEAAA